MYLHLKSLSFSYAHMFILRVFSFNVFVVALFLAVSVDLKNNFQTTNITYILSCIIFSFYVRNVK